MEGLTSLIFLCARADEYVRLRLSCWCTTSRRTIFNRCGIQIII
jgi:hypothetical protein